MKYLLSSFFISIVICQTNMNAGICANDKKWTRKKLTAELERLDAKASELEVRLQNSTFIVQGPKGATGAVGDAGATGPQGIPGVIGQQGPVGDMGPIGPKGYSGDRGLPGGPPGPMGDPNFEVGPKGPIGSRGNQGPRGPQGLPGKNGKNGLAGATGQTGPKGPEGAQGPQGPRGTKGKDVVTPPTAFCSCERDWDDFELRKYLVDDSGIESHYTMTWFLGSEFQSASETRSACLYAMSYYCNTN